MNSCCIRQLFNRKKNTFSPLAPSIGQSLRAQAFSIHVTHTQPFHKNTYQLKKKNAAKQKIFLRQTRNEHNHINRNLRKCMNRESLKEHFTYLIWKAIITWLMCFISNYSINSFKYLEPSEVEITIKKNK